MNTKEFHFTALCHEQGKTTRFVADLNLWGDGLKEAFTNTDPSKMTEGMYKYKFMNGSFRMILNKLNSPNRWRHL